MLQNQPTIKFEPPPVLDPLRHALFLDLDGTLVDFAAHPEQVVASDDLRALLTSLSYAMSGAVALITGRTIASADSVLNGVLAHVAGIHGLEQRSGGAIARTENDVSPIADALAEAAAMIGKGALKADIEDKGAALALHYRRSPDAAEAVRRAGAELAERHGLSLIEGNMVVELKLGQRTKGDAVTAFMTDAPFKGRMPIAVGDDITDEDAFAVVEALGGVAILVGAERQSAARHRLDDTRAVMDWLKSGVAL